MTRHRYVYNSETKMVEEVGADWTDTPRRAQTPTEELTYGGLAATDGTLINSRKKHREYMKRNNLTVADDFRGAWEQAAKQRENFYQGKAGQKERRESIARAMEQRYRR